jgi:hypothetical protein
MKLAIVVGVCDYQYEKILTACKSDAFIIKTVFEKMQKFDDICYMSSPKSQDAKRQITDFINKYKGKTIDEFVFYYSGHGTRFDDDFFYLFSDYRSDKREGTALRNTELDGLIRNLSPGLTVKIVDACYAGTTYIKSEGDVGPILEKSAKDNLNKVYFLYSSSETETSLATKDYSLFTYSFLEALAKNPGAIRYRDIMAHVADDMGAQSRPKPVFVVQADNTEIFGTIEMEVVTYVETELKIKSSTESDIELPEANTLIVDDLLTLVRQKSDTEFCTKSEADSNLTEIRNLLSESKWPADIQSFFNVGLSDIRSGGGVPNGIAIGKWLSKSGPDEFFAAPEYSNEVYEIEEYKELPKKPHRSAFVAISARNIFGEDKEYKLEKVQKRRQILKGFEFTADEATFKAAFIQFTPKHVSLERYSLTLVALCSRKTLVLFYSYEYLPRSDWDSYSYPNCLEWKNKTMQLKSLSAISAAIDEVIVEVSSFLRQDIRGKISK